MKLKSLFIEFGIDLNINEEGKVIAGAKISELKIFTEI